MVNGDTFVVVILYLNIPSQHLNLIWSIQLDF